MRGLRPPFRWEVEMNSSIEIEIGDFEYELEVMYFDPGQAAKGWDPGAGAEIELGKQVKVWGLVEKEVGPGSFNAVPGVVKRITLDEFIDLFAEDKGIKKMSESNTRAAASAQLEEQCIEYMIQKMEDDYDDSDV